MTTSNNAKHKFWIVDPNGFRRATATVRSHAMTVAQRIADESGLDMTVCYSRRFGFIGTRHFAIPVRSRNWPLIRRRVFLTNGNMAVL